MPDEENLFDTIMDVLTKEFYISYILANKIAKAIVKEVNKK